MRTVIVVTLTGVVACAGGGAMSPTDLLRSAPTYNGKTVTVAGTVKSFHADFTPDPSVEFDLCDASNCVHVFQRKGDANETSGEKRTVVGRFSVRKQFGPSPFFYEVEADAGP